MAAWQHSECFYQLLQGQRCHSVNDAGGMAMVVEIFNDDAAVEQRQPMAVGQQRRCLAEWP
jgi:hypothetical protein